MIIQIYEIQSAQEARTLLRLGVDHVGSVSVEETRRRDPMIKATTETVRAEGGRSCLIPLFAEDALLREAIAFYQPDIIHLCETLAPDPKDRAVSEQIDRQIAIRRWFPQLEIMRSIPIGTPASSARIPSLAWAARFEPWTDWFLIDTLLTGADQDCAGCDQPVQGFVGITGRTCDWDVARQLVEQSKLPVILAGGLGPDNVSDAVAAVRPAGVDSCTLTNAVDAAGRPIRFKKDLRKVEDFVWAARNSAGQNGFAKKMIVEESESLNVIKS
jgi:phosphoribosylanthranilate isomerase